MMVIQGDCIEVLRGFGQPPYERASARRIPESSVTKVIRREFQVELNALAWIDDKSNWRQWQREMRGRALKARWLTKMSNAGLRIRMTLFFWRHG